MASQKEKLAKGVERHDALIQNVLTVDGDSEPHARHVIWS